MAPDLERTQPHRDVPHQRPEGDLRPERGGLQHHRQRHRAAQREHAAARAPINRAVVPRRAGASRPSSPTARARRTRRCFPAPIIADTFDNFYVGALDWVMSPKLFANVTVGLFDYGSDGCGAGDAASPHVRRLELPERELQLSRDPGCRCDRQRLRRLPVEQRHGVRRLQAQLHHRRLSYFANKWGQHSIKAGFQYRAHRQRRLGGAQYPTINLNWGSARTALDGRQRARHLRPLHRDAGLQLRRHSHQRPRPVPAGRVDRRTQPHAQSRPAHRQGRDPVLHGRQPRASSSGSRTRSRRASASPGTSRATASGRATAAWASSTTPRSSRCRAACSAPSTRSPTTDARHVQLAVDPVRPSAGARARAARARSSSRSTSATRRTRTTTS